MGAIPAGRAGLAASAVTLARKLDTDAGLATAAVARELRATLEALMKDEDGGSDEFADVMRQLSATVQHPAQR